KPGRRVVLDIKRVEIAHAWVHGVPPGAIAIDAEAASLEGSVSVKTSPLAVHVAVPRAGVHVRGLPRGLDVAGDVNNVAFDVPGSGGRGVRITTSFAGQASGIPVTASASLDDDRVDASVSAPRVEASKVRVLVPEAPVAEDVVDFRAHATGTL